ncbi:MAG: ArsR/SmtB family transcription factor [Phycisphaerales bacterium]
MNRTARSIPVVDRLVALGDPIRLRLLRLLEREELSVGEIARVLQLPQSTVSRHLKVLAELPGGRRNSAGWLARRTSGTATWYRLVLDDLDTSSRALWLAVREQLGEAPELGEDSRRLAGVLADRRTDTQAFFGRVAGEWDSVRDELFGSAFTLQALLTLLPPGWTVADLGCGTGNVSELLAPVVKRVIAVDQSEPMLSAARKRVGSGAKNVEFVRGDLTALPLADESVDAAICVLVLHHLPEPEAAVREMARIIRPGGVMLLVDMVSHGRESYRHSMGHRWQGFDVPSMVRMIASSGMHEPRLVVLPSASAAKGPGLFAATAFKESGKREG